MSLGFNFNFNISPFKVKKNFCLVLLSKRVLSQWIFCWVFVFRPVYSFEFFYYSIRDFTNHDSRCFQLSFFKEQLQFPDFQMDPRDRNSNRSNSIQFKLFKWNLSEMLRNWGPGKRQGHCMWRISSIGVQGFSLWRGGH